MTIIRQFVCASLLLLCVFGTSGCSSMARASTYGRGSSGGGLPVGTLVGPVVGSTTASIAVTGLSGETDGDYEGVVHIVVSNSLVGAPDLQFLPNGATGTATCVEPQIYSGGALFSQTAFLSFGQYTLGDVIDAYFRISSKKGAARFFTATVFRSIAGGSFSQFTADGAWMDSGTTMTGFTIRFSTNTAGDIAAGSFIKWRALGFTAG